MAYTFLKARGQEVGKSLVEADKLDVAREALKEAEARGVRFLLPVDHLLADKFAPDARTQLFEGDGPFPADWMALDIGSVDCRAVHDGDRAGADHSLEWSPWVSLRCLRFQGNVQCCEALAENAGAMTIVGGGDSVLCREAGGRGRQDEAHLHRRWCVARIS